MEREKGRKQRGQEENKIIRKEGREIERKTCMSGIMSKKKMIVKKMKDETVMSFS